MPRPFVFPDPKDRTINNPTVIVSPTHVLGNFNQGAERGDKRTTLDIEVKQWFKRKALQLGWSMVKFQGNQCVLTASLILNP